MAYATVDQFRQEFKGQIGTESGSDAVIQRKLDAATALIDAEVGFAFGISAAGSRTLYGDGTIYLAMPPYTVGSITALTSISGITPPARIERDGMLIAVDSSGVIPGEDRPVPVSLTWREGVPYTVAATYGYAAVPADIVEACIQIAARAWRGRDAGFSDVVGVEGGGAVGYNGALPKMVVAILDNYRERATPGVW